MGSATAGVDAFMVGRLTRWAGSGNRALVGWGWLVFFAFGSSGGAVFLLLLGILPSAGDCGGIGMRWNAILTCDRKVNPCRPAYIKRRKDWRVPRTGIST